MTSGSETTTAMADHELDAVYTNLCQTMTQLGESQCSMFLARFALLAIDRIANADATRRLIAAAAEGLGPAAPP